MEPQTQVKDFHASPQVLVSELCDPAIENQNMIAFGLEDNA